MLEKKITIIRGTLTPIEYSVSIYNLYHILIVLTQTDVKVKGYLSIFQCV